MSVIFRSFPLKRDIAARKLVDLARDFKLVGCAAIRQDLPKTPYAKQPPWVRDLCHLICFDRDWLASDAVVTDQFEELLAVTISDALCGSNDLPWYSFATARAIFVALGMWEAGTQSLIHGRSFYEFVKSINNTDALLRHMKVHDSRLGWLAADEIRRGLAVLKEVGERVDVAEPKTLERINSEIEEIRPCANVKDVGKLGLAAVTKRLETAISLDCELLFYNDPYR
jgi:hypothetical protein